MSRRRDRGSVLRLILELARRPEGVTTADMVRRLQCQSNAPILPTAAERGHIFKAARQGCRMHWFATAEAAAAWEALGPVIAPPKPPKVKPPKAERIATTPKPAAVKAKMGAKVPHRPTPAEHQKPPTYTAGPSKTAPRTNGDPIITSATCVTVAPTPLPRFHVPDDFRGAFSLAGIGRDVQTGRGWA